MSRVGLENWTTQSQHDLDIPKSLGSARLGLKDVKSRLGSVSRSKSLGSARSPDPKASARLGLEKKASTTALHQCAACCAVREVRHGTCVG